METITTKLSNFIDGKFVPPIKGNYLDNYEPASGTVYSQVPDSTDEDVDAAVAAAKKAFKPWARKTTQERSNMLNRIADLLEKRIPEFAAAESRDQGKPVKLATMVDIPRAVSNFRFYAGAILHHEDRATDYDNIALNYVMHQPVGVAGLISPWNLPLYLLTWKIAPAIAVGNTCVCKPSEMTSVTAHMLCDVINEAGVPAGVVNMVFGTGPKAGNALVVHPDVPLISFTGGTKTGEIIQKTSAPFCKKLSLELGGKNPNIIFEDANLEECIATTVRSSFTNQGEVCLCGSRIFIQDTIYDEFVRRFTEKVAQLVVGDPRSDKTDLGALISTEHLAKIEYYVGLVAEEGGKILHGGKRPTVEGRQGGYYYTPTIIAGVKHTGRVMQEEIFGPVVTVTPFHTEEEALEMANSIQYGLAGIVWTENGRRAHRVAQQLEAGIVWVNCWMLRDLRTPFGGVKKSGVGREGGESSLEFYTEAKTVCVKYS